MKFINLNPSTKDEFHKTVHDATTPTLMLLHANWCPHCIQLHPVWEMAKKHLGLKNHGINVVEVEYTHMNLLPPALKSVKGFPTIEIVKSGKVKSEYQGDRSPEDIVRFAVSHAHTTVPKKRKPVQVAAKKRPASAPVPKKRKILKEKH
jgi:thiol-disulfide isomerase/thioredoxin